MPLFVTVVAIKAPDSPPERFEVEMKLVAVVVVVVKCPTTWERVDKPARELLVRAFEVSVRRGMQIRRWRVVAETREKH